MRPPATTFGLALCLLITLGPVGCISPDKARFLESFPTDPAKDLESTTTPRVSRSQSPPALAPSGAPRPVEVAQVGPPPPLPPAPGATPPPPAVPSAPAAKPVSFTPAPSVSGRTAYQAKVAAWVNGKPIFEADVFDTLRPELFRLQARGLKSEEAMKQVKEMYNLILENNIEREILYQDAIKKLEAGNPKAIKKLKDIAKEEFNKKIRDILVKNHVTEEQFMEGLRQRGTTMAALERVEECKFFADEYLRSRIFPLMARIGRKEIEKYYYDHLTEFQRLDSVEWQDIFIAAGTKRNPTREDARRFAAEVRARLERGEDLARLLEFDDGDSKYRKGAGAGRYLGQIRPPELESYLFRMSEGGVGPVVELSTGFHVVRVTKRVFAGRIPLDYETQRRIHSKLRNEVIEQERKHLLYILGGRAVIEKARSVFDIDH